MPWWPPSSVVLTAVTMKSARTPLVMNIFEPLTTRRRRPRSAASDAGDVGAGVGLGDRRARAIFSPRLPGAGSARAGRPCRTSGPGARDPDVRADPRGQAARAATRQLLGEHRGVEVVAAAAERLGNFSPRKPCSAPAGRPCPETTARPPIRACGAARLHERPDGEAAGPSCLLGERGQRARRCPPTPIPAHAAPKRMLAGRAHRPPEPRPGFRIRAVVEPSARAPVATRRAVLDRRRHVPPRRSRRRS